MVIWNMLIKCSHILTGKNKGEVCNKYCMIDIINVNLINNILIRLVVIRLLKVIIC